MQSKRDDRPPLTVRRKIVFGLLTTVGFFLALEGVLALAQLPRDRGLAQDPWVGFSQGVPLFQEASDHNQRFAMQTNPAKLNWFNPQTFARTKSPGVRRIFSLGGSTTYGRPYDDETSFTGWLREYLANATDAGSFEVINAGGISYASYRVVNVMKELSRYEPDLFIVYTAHNEFLEHRTYANVFKHPAAHRVGHLLSKTRTWRLAKDLVKPRPQTSNVEPAETLSGEVNELLNHTVGPQDYHRDVQWREKVVAHYRWNLNQMVDVAQSCGAEIIFVLPASNESACAPFKSEFSAATSSADREQIQQLLSEARLLQREDPPQQEAALEKLRNAVALDPLYAQSQYQYGTALLDAGQPAEAAAALAEAIEQDVCPLRATRDILDSLRDVAMKRNVPLVPFDRWLRAENQKLEGHRVLGRRLFLDHVHPKIDAHRALALELYEMMQSSTSLRPPNLTDENRRNAEATVRGRIDVNKHGVALRNLAKVFHWSGKFDEAASHAEGALEKLNDDPESMYLLADCHRQQGEEIEAFGIFHELLTKHPAYDRARIPFGVLFYQGEDYQEAKRNLTLGLVAYPDDAGGHYWLGVTHLALGEFELAQSSLNRALELAPDDPGTLFALGEAWAATEQFDEAYACLEQVLRIVPDHVNTHYAMGSLKLQQKRLDDAIEHFSRVLELSPDHEGAKQGLIEAKETPRKLLEKL